MRDMKKNAKVWCWWKSRNLYFTGRIIQGKYEFIDTCDAITMIGEDQLDQLEMK